MILEICESCSKEGPSKFAHEIFSLVSADQAVAECSEIFYSEPSQVAMFLPANILKESNLVCAYARADKIINSEDCDHEMMMQARGFLMEIFSKERLQLENLAKLLK